MQRRDGIEVGVTALVVVGGPALSRLQNALLGDLCALVEARSGELKRIETQGNEKTELYLSPEEESDVGMGMPGLGGWVTVLRSKVGVVVDGRGRPLNLPSGEDSRAKTLHDWLWELGG